MPRWLRLRSSILSTVIDCTCPLCAGGEVQSLGTIVHPEPATVAGIPIDLGDHPYQLARCRDCGFSFKWPAIDERKLLACYEQASAECWEEQPDPYRRRFDELKALIVRWHPSGRLLDVGCYNGALQAYLGPAWEHFGVEPSRAAAGMAASRGVTVLGASVAVIPALTQSFDVVIAVDLIEHLATPRLLLEQLAGHLAPGGIVAFATGDTDAWSWRLAGAHYWYCALPEHLSFFNERSMRYLAESSGLVSIAHVRTSHIRARRDKRVRKAVKNTLATLLRRTPGVAALRPHAKPPLWITARDHMIHVMQRPGA
jgi:SAM-dependent methyltransferase